MRDYSAATAVIRELFVRLTCGSGGRPLKTSLKLPPLAGAEYRVNEDFTGGVTRDLFPRKYSFRPLNYIVTDLCPYPPSLFEADLNTCGNRFDNILKMVAMNSCNSCRIGAAIWGT